MTHKFWSLIFDDINNQYVIQNGVYVKNKQNYHEMVSWTCQELLQGSYRQGQVKFKDFSRTNLTIFKDLLLRNTYTIYQ